MKKNKLLAVLLLGGLTFAGCGNQDANQTETKTQTQNEAVEEKEENTNVAKAASLEEEPRYGTPVKIGFDGDLCIAGQNLAEINGYFKEAGVDVEFVNTKSGKDALSSGQLDAMTGEFGGLLVPATKGLKYVFSTASHSGCKSLYVLKDSEYQNTSDLVKKSVAVTNGIGNSGHNTLLRFLIHDDVNPDDINIKPVDSAAVIQSLESGEIQGAVLDDQFAQEFLQRDIIRPIRSLTSDEDFGKEVCCVTAFNKEFVDNNPMLAELVAEAIEKGNQYAAENPEDAIKVLQDKNLAEGDPEVAADLLKAYDYTLTNKDGVETLRTYFDDYKKLKLIPDNKTTDELMEEFWRPLGNGEVEVVRK